MSRDLEATRKFYEDVIGLPLLATWCEKDLLFGAERTYCHLFFGLADGGALAFFQFADPEDQEQFGPKMPFTPFHHIALHVDKETQDGIEKRLAAAGYKEPQSFVLEHGYCRSVYATDPNGMIVEFTLDHPDVEKINKARRADAHSELKRWLGRRSHLEQHVSMRGSTERILTTHVGSLPRSQAVTDVLFARERARSSDKGAAAAVISDAVVEVVRRQVETGVDVVSDGESSKISYATYIADRFTGFGGDTPREPGQDLVDFPRLLKKLAETGHDREVPPAALRRRDQSSRTPDRSRGPAQLRAARSTRRGRSKPS